MLRVGDLDKSIDFYTRVLGLKLIRKSDNEAYKYTLAFLGTSASGPGHGTVLEHMRGDTGWHRTGCG